MTCNRRPCSCRGQGPRVSTPFYQRGNVPLWILALVVPAIFVFFTFLGSIR